MGDLRWQVVDLGAKKGGAVALFLKSGRNYFGAGLDAVVPRGCLCIESNKKYRAEVERRGYTFWRADVLEVEEFPRADYYIAWNFLEHLPNRDASKDVLRRALVAAVVGVSLLLPSFESEPQLERADLQFVWTRWTGHPSYFTVSDAVAVIEEFPEWSPQIRSSGEVGSSESPLLIPRPKLDADGWDEQRYDPKMGPKPLVMFDPPVTTRWVIDIRRAP
jgi:hypothetical protein